MSELGETFAAWAEVKREKRASNTVHSTALLTGAGVIFDRHNGGAHLVVMAGPHTVDFWPSTGLWIVRKQGTKRRGVRKLIAFVEQSRSATHPKDHP